jgi:LPXTG-motif cell wall-anchored protein
VQSPEVGVMGLIVLLLVIWIALSVLGFVIKGLVWLAIIGLVLFVATAAFGFLRRKNVNR